MLRITELVDMYREQGYDDDEIDAMISRDLEEASERFINEYEDDPFVQEGYHQQDVIDMYRYER